MAKLIGKDRTWYCAALLALLIAALFCGCTGDGMDKKAAKEIEGTFPGLDAKTERQLRQDLLAYRGQSIYTVDNVPIDYYFGTYNGCVVIAILGDATVCDNITVADTVFGFPYSAAMLAWKQDEKTGSGHFYDVREAYDLGLLTKDDVENMYKLYRGNNNE